MERSTDQSDEIFILKGEQLNPLPARSMRAGLFKRTLEDALMTLIERHPELIPGKQIDPGSDDPPRFVLLRREMPVGNWSVDHLLVDQRGIPTLVEGKLLESPEARREVIGQIMEYAANAVDSWANGQVRLKAEEYWAQRGKSVDDFIRDQFGSETDIEELWKTIEDNIQQRRIRLIIAADELRPEVRRIIEFLNVEMTNTEIYGLELRCYGDESSSLVLVPFLTGRTQAAVDRKGGVVSSVLWTTDRLQGAYDALTNGAVGRRLTTVLNWATGRGCFLEARAKNPTFGLRGRSGDRIFTFFVSSTIYWFMNEKHYPDGASERDRLMGELEKMKLLDPGFKAEEVISGRNLQRTLADLNDDEMEGFLKVLSRYCGTVEGAPTTAT